MLLRNIFFTFCSVSFLFGCSGQEKKNQPGEAVIQGYASDSLDKLTDEMYMIVGTYTGGGSSGIYVYALDTASGSSRYVSEINVSNPSFLTLDNAEKYVYAVSENDDVETSSANAFEFDKKSGILKFINKQLTGGGAPCHISVDPARKFLLTANYMGGSLSVFKIRADGGLEPAIHSIGFSGKGIDPERQKQSHPHFATFSPDKKNVFVTDLGTDKIHKFALNDNDSAFISIATPAYFKVSDGLGPRHMEFHPNGKYAYVITELGGDVLVFDYAEGILVQKQSVKADMSDARGSADIHLSPDGKFLYASTRHKDDGIAIFSVRPTDGKLEKVGFKSTAKHPRNFALTPDGGLLLVANRDSDLIQVFRRDPESGLLHNTQHDIHLSMPVCIKFVSKY